jgi:mitotic spindle assembly checkpoint protein MAD2
MGANDTIITLKGSVEIVTEFFFTAINSILYQRGKLWAVGSELRNIGVQLDVIWQPQPRMNIILTASLVNSRLLLVTGIYQPETFKRESKYGLTVLTTTDQGLLTYLGNVMSQMGSWLTDGDVQRLVVVVTGIDSGETLERWQFNVSVEDGDSKVSIMTRNDENISQNVANNNLSGDGAKKKMGSKTAKEVHDEIQAIIRQITASVSWMTSKAH